MAERDDPPGGVPDQDADPVVWDPVQRRFVPESERAASPSGGGRLRAAPAASGVARPKGPDARRFRIPSSAVDRALPSQPGTPPSAAIGGAGPSPGATGATAARPIAPQRFVVPAPNAAPGSGAGAAAATPGPASAPA
ncbi:MAG: hypothetical protein ABIV94_00690, partial [Acidimicrobiales bacterium]